MKLTPHILRSAYDFLDETYPFCNWALPHAEDVRFEVVRDPSRRGWARANDRRIGISSAYVGCLRVLMEVMAHEMCHFAADAAGEKSEHGPLFKKFAKAACKEHGFDYKSFV